MQWEKMMKVTMKAFALPQWAALMSGRNHLDPTTMFASFAVSPENLCNLA